MDTSLIVCVCMHVCVRACVQSHHLVWIFLHLTQIQWWYMINIHTWGSWILYQSTTGPSAIGKPHWHWWQVLWCYVPSNLDQSCDEINSTTLFVNLMVWYIHTMYTKLPHNICKIKLKDISSLKVSKGHNSLQIA